MVHQSGHEDVAVRPSAECDVEDDSRGEIHPHKPRRGRRGVGHGEALQGDGRRDLLGVGFDLEFGRFRSHLQVVGYRRGREKDEESGEGERRAEPGDGGREEKRERGGGEGENYDRRSAIFPDAGS